ncbi:MAG: DNA primase [Planctomycetota bacterium]|nr:DNA primase [Planctomycetota bacterium]MDA1249194.1 DNA primase [Planctomycetota bacterium]
MAEFSPDFKEQVRSRTEIVGLISESLTLIPAGADYKALCPFHDDHSPSMMVYPDRQTYRCWVCQTGGDAFSWVMNRESVGFREALEMLANRAHIEIPKRSQYEVEQAAQKSDVYEVLKWAEGEYHRTFLHSPEAKDARDYVQGRGFTDDTIEQFRLGYQPREFDWLQRKAATQFDRKLLESAQLISPRKNGTGFTDFFVDRVMFPIHDERARTVAFGGRLIPGHPEFGGKYLNSRESPVFHKSRVLFGLNHARDPIKESVGTIVVEGYTDCIALHQAGVRNAVATLGTALTESHVTRLKAFAPRVTLVYDGDKPGLDAANKAVSTLLAQQIDLRVMTLGEKEDPADFVEKHGGEEFQKVADQAPEAWEFKLQREIQTKGASTVDARERVLTEMLTLLARVPGLAGTAREDLILGRLATRLRLNESSIRSHLKKSRSQERSTRVVRVNTADQEAASEQERPKEERIDFYNRPLSKDDKLESEFLECVLTQPNLMEQARQEIGVGDIQNPHLKLLAQLVYDVSELGEIPTFDRVMLETERNELKGLAIWVTEQARQKGIEKKLLDEKSEDGLPVLFRENLDRLKWRREEMSHRSQLEQQSMTGSSEQDALARLKQVSAFHQKRAAKR